MQRRIISLLAGAMVSFIGMSAFVAINLGSVMPLGDAVTEGR
jgi:hypothetical protein